MSRPTWGTTTATTISRTRTRPKTANFHAYEVLADPAYRIDVALEDEEFYEELRTHLESGTSVYPPSLGKSEYLATITDVEAGRTPTRITDEEIVDVDSVVPGSLADAIPQSSG